MEKKIAAVAGIFLATPIALGGRAVAGNGDRIPEKLRLVSEYKQGQERRDEAHAWEAVTIGHLRDGWVRNVTAVHFGYSCVSLKAGAKRVTVQDCAFLDPVLRRKLAR